MSNTMMAGNVKRGRGRPRSYDMTAEGIAEFQAKVDSYFAECDGRSDPYTLTGLAAALGMNRRTLLEYSREDEFSPAIKEARLRIEEYWEKRLFEPSCTGAIFWLKNNAGWKDRQDLVHTGTFAHQGIAARLQRAEARLKGEKNV